MFTKEQLDEMPSPKTLINEIPLHIHTIHENPTTPKCIFCGTCYAKDPQGNPHKHHVRGISLTVHHF